LYSANSLYKITSIQTCIYGGEGGVKSWEDPLSLADPPKKTQPRSQFCFYIICLKVCFRVSCWSGILVEIGSLGALETWQITPKGQLRPAFFFFIFTFCKNNLEHDILFFMYRCHSPIFRMLTLIIITKTGEFPFQTICRCHHGEQQTVSELCLKKSGGQQAQYITENMWIRNNNFNMYLVSKYINILAEQKVRERFSHCCSVYIVCIDSPVNPDKIS
jgi:hypothetical protein